MKVCYRLIAYVFLVVFSTVNCSANKDDDLLIKFNELVDKAANTRKLSGDLKALPYLLKVHKTYRILVEWRHKKLLENGPDADYEPLAENVYEAYNETRTSIIEIIRKNKTTVDEQAIESLIDMGIYEIDNVLVWLGTSGPLPEYLPEPRKLIVELGDRAYKAVMNRLQKIHIPLPSFKKIPLDLELYEKDPEKMIQELRDEENRRQGIFAEKVSFEDLKTIIYGGYLLADFGREESLPLLEDIYKKINAWKSAEALGPRSVAAFALSTLGGNMMCIEDKNSGPERVVELIKQLTARDSFLRMSAILRLVNNLNAKEAMPEIVKRLEDDNATVREVAVKALGKLGVRKAISDIIRKLEDVDASVRRAAICALAELDSRGAIPEIIKRLEDNHWWVRVKAVKLLGELDVKEAIPEIIKKLEDNDDSVRYSALELLGKFEAKEATAEVKKRLKDEKEYIRKEAREVLEKWGVEADE